MIKQGLNRAARSIFAEITGKDDDSIGISGRDIFMISMPFHYSEGAADL